MSSSMNVALGVIRREHRSLAAVVNSMKCLIAQADANGTAPDFRLLWSMVFYIDAFPDQQHHPKEDFWLFDRVRARTSLADGLMAELQAQHRQEAPALDQIRRALGNFEAGVAGSSAVLLAAVSDYADFTWKHLKAEETQLFPVAEAHLTESDWDELAAAFAENVDPLSGAEVGAALEAMFRNIVWRTPAPLGLGPASSA